jgi:hypothetical protein
MGSRGEPLARNVREIGGEVGALEVETERPPKATAAYSGKFEIFL